MHVNTARITLFSQMSHNIENIPPTQATLDQHIKRSSYQSEHEQSVEVQPELPDVTGWGWETPQTAGYVPTCSHEEAYIRMLLHVKDPMNCGLKSVTIRTVGTDVVVVDVAHFQGLQTLSNSG